MKTTKWRIGNPIQEKYFSKFLKEKTVRRIEIVTEAENYIIVEVDYYD